MDLTKLARPLGWFSIALGAVELIAPRRLAAAHGKAEAAPVVGAFGAREIAAGIGILAAPQRSAGLWARAAGDLLDIGVECGEIGLRHGVAQASRRPDGNP